MNVEERTRALLGLVEEYREAKSREIVGAAQVEAQALVARAFGLARGRVHEAIVDERRRYNAAVAGAHARLHTRRRLAHQGRETAMLVEGWPLLREALSERWREPGGRRRWAETHLGRALAALPRERWEISHAPGWPEDERQALRRWLAERGGPETTFTPDSTLVSGFRVRAGHNTLDATHEGLLAERKSIEGRLLHLLEAAGEDAA